jgi:triacylglycerol lipase
MKIDRTWKALTSPGEASEYFTAPCLPELALKSSFYNHSTAWMLSEMSRLVYRQGEDEIGNQAACPARSEILGAVGMKEICFLNQDGTQCTLIEAERSGTGKVHILVFRGTNDLKDWVTNLDTVTVENSQGGSVHKGFKNALDKVWPSLQPVLDNLDTPVFFTGHSLGGALAVAAAARSVKLPLAVYSFGSPRVGNSDFNALLEASPVYRIVNNSDLVPTLPPSKFGFKHAGTLYQITATGKMLIDPDLQIVRKSRLEALLDFKDLGTQLQTLDPHRVLYEHSPVNYSSCLKELMLNENAG